MDRECGEMGDPVGLETLEHFADALEFNQWLFKQIVPFCGGRILEVGSGIGNISRYLLNLGSPVTLTDVREEYCSRLSQFFGSNRNIASIRQLDLSVPDFGERYNDLTGQYDSVVALNVIEHIKDEKAAIRNARSLLGAGGRLIILVPALQWLYNSLDKGLGHFRRYTSHTLQNALESEGIKILHIRYFNFAGIPGWWFTGSVLQKKVVPYGQLKIFNSLVPIFSLMDQLTGHSVGISVIAVGSPA
jgi:SAM-dependent methyltransferase